MFSTIDNVHDMLPELFPTQISAQRNIWNKFRATRRAKVISIFECAAYAILKGDKRIDYIFYNSITQQCSLCDISTIYESKEDDTIIDTLYIYKGKEL